jgi:hypothetical protein
LALHNASLSLGTPLPLPSPSASGTRYFVPVLSGQF